MEIWVWFMLAGVFVSALCGAVVGSKFGEWLFNRRHGGN